MSRLGQFRRDTLQNWKSANPILADGEFALVAADPNAPHNYTYWVVGNGVSKFTELPMNSIESSGINISGITDDLNQSDSSTQVISQKGIRKGFASVNVYDASVANAIDYATLADAIAVVPDYYKNRGLILKFKNSTSNKEEIYRLEASTWSTNIADWKQLDNLEAIVELQDAVFPLTLNIHVFENIVEYNPSGNSITVTITGTHKGSSISLTNVKVTCGSNILNLGNGNNLSGNISLAAEGLNIIKATGTYERQTSSASTNVRSVRKSNMGINAATTIEALGTTDLGHSALLASASRITQCQATSKGYLWIVTPFKVSAVATDPNFTFVVAMNRLNTTEYNGTGGLNYYRSIDMIDISNLTYYVR